MWHNKPNSLLSTRKGWGWDENMSELSESCHLSCEVGVNKGGEGKGERWDVCTMWRVFEAMGTGSMA